MSSMPIATSKLLAVYNVNLQTRGPVSYTHLTLPTKA